MVPVLGRRLTPVVRRTGTVAELHGRDAFDGVAGPTVVWCDFTDTAVVLGSRQQPDLVDAATVTAEAVSVVRRRSGGGAVLLVPGSVIWIDLVVPAGTPGWTDDVRGAMVHAGEVWRAALGDPALAVHDGGMVATAWSELVCFAGLGPGEVLAGGAKLVGLSQRRTRAGAWIQGLVHTAPVAADTPRYLRPVPPGGPAFPAVATWPDARAPELAAALAAALGARLDGAPIDRSQFARSARTT